MIFLDNNSTTKTDIRVVEKMIPFFTDKYGNSSSKSHKFGWEANDAIFDARKKVSNYKQGGIAKGCGAIMEKKRKKTKKR